MDLADFRNQIDDIDKELVSLFIRRMEIAAQVAEYKRVNHLPIQVPAREQEILHRLSGIAGAEMEAYVRELYAEIFKLSRDYQSMKNSKA